MGFSQALYGGLSCHLIYMPANKLCKLTSYMSKPLVGCYKACPSQKGLLSQSGSLFPVIEESVM